MPGLFGILAKRPDLPPREVGRLGRRMALAMQTAPWLRSEVWSAERFCGGRVHLGVVHRAPQPVASGDGRIEMWFDGEAYGPDATGDSPLALDEVLSLLRSDGHWSQVDGAFNLAAFRADESALTLVTDRLGLRPLYFAETNEWFAYAAEVKSLLAILPRQPDLDRTSLRQFLAADYLFGHRTWWSGIELLPPASYWRIDARRTETRRYWSFGDIEHRPVDEREAVSEFGTIWSRSVSRRVRPGRSPLLLSGGLDSRMLLAELRAQGAELEAFTFGTPGSADIEIARRCASLLRVPHRALKMTADNWWLGRERAIWRTDGLVNAKHLHVAIAAPYFRSGNRYTLKNSTGDTLFGGSKLRGLTAQWAREPRRLLAKHLAETPFFSREEAIEATLPDCRGYLEGPSSDCFVISQRQRRMILTGPLAMRAHCEVVNPGVDLELLQLFLGGLSDEQRRDGRFHHEALVHHYPELFRDIPRNSTGRGLAERRRYRIARGLRARLADRLRNVPLGWRLAKRIDLRRGVFHDYPAFLRGSDVVSTVVRDELMIDQYLNGRARRYLEQARDSGMWDAGTIIGLLTVETYLRQVDNSASAKLWDIRDVVDPAQRA